MKGRTWVLFLILILVMFSAAVMVSIERYHLDSMVRDYINRTVSRQLGGEFESTSFFITPFSFGLRNASIRLSETPVSVLAERVRVEFNLWSIIKNSFRIVSGTRNIYFDEPTIIWRLGEESVSTTHRGFSPDTELSLTDIPSVRIHLIRGSFIFSRGDSSLTFTDNVSGYLDARSDEEMHINAHGSILSDSLNTVFSARINRKTGNAVFDVTGKQCDMSRRNLELVTGDIVPSSGMIDFHLSLEKNGNEYNRSGEFVVRGGAFTMKEAGITVSDIGIDGSIDGDEVFFPAVSGNIFGISPELNGVLRLKPKAELNLSLTAGNVNIGQAVKEVFPELENYPEGVTDLAASIHGSLDDIVVTVNLHSEKLSYDTEEIQDFDLRATISNGKLNLERIQGRMKDYRLAGRGRSSIMADRNGRRDFALFLRADPSASDGRPLTLTLNGSGRTEAEDYSASYRFSMLSANANGVSAIGDSLDTFDGHLRLRKDILEFTAENSVASLTGSALDIYDRCSIDADLVVRRFPLLHYTGFNPEAFLIEGKNKITGTIDSLYIRSNLALHAGENINSLMTSETHIYNPFGEGRNVAFNAVLDNHHLRFSHPLKWDVRIRSNNSNTTAVVHDPSGALLSLDVRHNTGELRGTLDLDGLPLEWIIDIFVREEFSHRGKLKGRAVIGGTIDNPHFTTPERIQATDLKLGGLDRLTGSGYVSGHFGELAFTDFKLYRDGIHILDSDSKWTKGNPYRLQAHGDSISLAAIGDIISDSRKIDGAVDYEAELEFTRRNGTIAGRFSIENGHFLDIPFDGASGVVTGGSSGFKVTDFSIRKNGIYTGTGLASSGYFWKDRTEEPGLKMDIALNGDLIRVLPSLTGSIRKSNGDSRLSVTFGGTWVEPVLFGGELHVTNAVIEPSFLVDKVTGIDASLIIDPTFETVTGYPAVRVQKAAGTVLGRRLVVRNIHVGDEEWPRIMNPELLSIVNSTAGLDFGVMLGRIERGNQRDTSLELNVPGFMKPRDTGTFLVGGENDNSFIVGASDTGVNLEPYIEGTITVMSGDITFPLLDVESNGGGDFLDDIFWNLSIGGGQNVNYYNEENIRWRVGGTTVSRTLARLDENSRFTVFGRLSDNSFRVTGSADSNSGTISYYGTEFDIERAEFRIDTSNENRPATLAAQAHTIVYDDSTGYETEIRLNVYFIDTVSGDRRDTLGRTNVIRNDFRAADTSRTIDAGALGTLQIEFTSSNPSDNTMERILARLGISPDNIVNAATGAFAAGVDNYYFDSLMRPFEDVIRKYMRIDVVRFTPSVLGNIMRSQFGYGDRYAFDKDFMLFDRSRIMLGEYIMDDFFLSYRGQYGVGQDFLSRRERGFLHEIGLQYLLQRNTRFQFNYNYDEIINKGEKRIEIRHDFEF